MTVLFVPLNTWTEVFPERECFIIYHLPLRSNITENVFTFFESILIYLMFFLFGFLASYFAMFSIQKMCHFNNEIYVMILNIHLRSKYM